jgi:hypothetical protein
MVSALLLQILLVGSAPRDAPTTADPFRDALVAAVHHFAEAGEVDHLRAALDKHPDLLEARRELRLGKPTHSDGYTPLHTAAAAGRNEAVALLIERRADVNATTGLGYTPLHLAAQRGQLEAVKWLVKSGATIDAKTTAVPEGYVPGGPSNAEPSQSPPIPARTALQIAEDLRHAEVVAFLKSAK